MTDLRDTEAVAREVVARAICAEKHRRFMVGLRGPMPTDEEVAHWVGAEMSEPHGREYADALAQAAIAALRNLGWRGR